MTVPGLTVPGQRIIAGTRKATFPGRTFLAPERFGTAIGIGIGLGSIVGAVNHNRVVGNAQVIQLIQQLPNMMIVFHQTIRV